MPLRVTRLALAAARAPPGAALARPGAGRAVVAAAGMRGADLLGTEPGQQPAEGAPEQTTQHAPAGVGPPQRSGHSVEVFSVHAHTLHP